MGVTRQAADETVSVVSFGARAVGAVVGVDANGVLGTGVADIAGPLAAAADAGFGELAVLVRRTTH